MTLLFLVPTRHHPTLFCSRPLITNTTSSDTNTTNFNTAITWAISGCQTKPIIFSRPLHCTSSSPVVVVDDSLPPPTEESIELSFGGCKTCGKEEIEKGCNGEGRIQGGIATVPGFGWWPIKAYRPCPGFVASGGRYRRKGQSMDEVASGRGGRETFVVDNTETEARKKIRDPRRFKR